MAFTGRYCLDDCLAQLFSLNVDPAYLTRWMLGQRRAKQILSPGDVDPIPRVVWALPSHTDEGSPHILEHEPQKGLASGLPKAG